MVYDIGTIPYLSPHFGILMLPSMSSPSSKSFLDPVRWHLNIQMTQMHVGLFEYFHFISPPQNCVNILAETNDFLAIGLAH